MPGKKCVHTEQNPQTLTSSSNHKFLVGFFIVLLVVLSLQFYETTTDKGIKKSQITRSH